jgi:hypothetical protein
MKSTNLSVLVGGLILSTGPLLACSVGTPDTEDPPQTEVETDQAPPADSTPADETAADSTPARPGENVVTTKNAQEGGQMCFWPVPEQECCLDPNTGLFDCAYVLGRPLVVDDAPRFAPVEERDDWV